MRGPGASSETTPHLLLVKRDTPTKFPRSPSPLLIDTHRRLGDTLIIMPGTDSGNGEAVTLTAQAAAFPRIRALVHRLRLPVILVVDMRRAAGPARSSSYARFPGNASQLHERHRHSARYGTRRAPLCRSRPEPPLLASCRRSRHLPASWGTRGARRLAADLRAFALQTFQGEWLLLSQSRHNVITGCSSLSALVTSGTGSLRSFCPRCDLGTAACTLPRSLEKGSPFSITSCKTLCFRMPWPVVDLIVR